MKLEKAIEILSHEVGLDLASADYKLTQSIKLGIEALKRCQIFREQHLFQAWILLPGETKE